VGAVPQLLVGDRLEGPVNESRRREEAAMSSGRGLTTAQLHQLDLAVAPLRRMITGRTGPCGIYLVGSLERGEAWRDVDIRINQANDTFD
jgi:hypothetical protein